MLPNKLKLYFDGSCYPKNPGGIAGFGWRLVSLEGEELKSDSGEICRGENATNNIGEYGAVRNGLRYLKEVGWKGELQILGDSQLIIRQLSGEYKVRKDTLIPFYNECISLLEGIDWTAIWVPREENQRCDELSKGKV